MSRKLKMCGDNHIDLPQTGCSDCEELQYQIDQLDNRLDGVEDWRDQFVEDGYSALNNKPTINGVTVEGNKTSEDYLITPITDADLIELTPFECYVPPCADSRVCYGETCCMIVGCDDSE